MCIHSLFRLQYPGKTLLECLQSPIFMAYHDGQPFNENHLRPCPMPENPKILRKLVKNAEANSLVFEAEKKE